MSSDGKPSVLVVDDDKSTRDGLERALGRTEAFPEGPEREALVKATELLLERGI